MPLICNSFEIIFLIQIRKCSSRIVQTNILLQGVPKQTFDTVCSSGQRLIGGKRNGNPEDQTVWRAANFAVNLYNRQSNSLYTQSLANVDKVTQQVINGILYQIRFHIVQTKCDKRREITADCLKVTINSPIKECYAEVIHREWTKQKFSIPLGKHVTCYLWSPSRNYVGFFFFILPIAF